MVGVIFSFKKKMLIHVSTWMNPEDTIPYEIGSYQKINTE